MSLAHGAIAKVIVPKERRAAIKAALARLDVGHCKFAPGVLIGTHVPSSQPQNLEMQPSQL